MVASTVTEDLPTCRHHAVPIDIRTGAIVTTMGLLYLYPVAIYPVIEDPDGLSVELRDPRTTPTAQAALTPPS